MSLEVPQTNNQELSHLDVIIESITKDLTKAKTNEEVDSIVQKGFQAIFSYTSDAYKTGKLIDNIIDSCREELNKKGVTV